MTPIVEVENITEPENAKRKETNYRIGVVKKYYKQMGLASVVEKVEQVTSFKYRVSMIGDVVQNVFVYKSIQSMKENYQSMLQIEDFFVFVQ